MASQRQIAANKRNAGKSSGPRTQQGKARSRMNALRHGFSSALIEASIALPKMANSTNDLNATPDAHLIAAHQRLRQIEIERVKIITEARDLATSSADALCMAVKRIAALERYSRQSYSKLKKQIAAPD